MEMKEDKEWKKGLTKEQVNERTKKGLINIQVEKTSKSIICIVRDNLMTFFNLINIILASMIISIGSFKNLLFLGIVIANTCIGIIQEIRAKRTLDRLSLITATKVYVIRDGEKQEVNIKEVVLDDTMLLTTGNQICADAIVKEGTLEVNEALISGEADVIVKNPGDHLFSGSFVVSGQAITQVEHIGKENFAYRITAQAKIMKKHKSELQKSLNVILKIISILIIPLGAGLFASQYFISHATFANAVVNMVAAVLGMIPEGLVLLTSIALAVGVIHLGKKKTLVHELFCIETLARIDTLCLDKTGTLTEGKMKVEDIILLDKMPIEEIMGNMLYYLKDENATFLAMKEYFADCNQYHALHVVPFSSARKYSGVVFEEKGTYLMGAYEFLFPGKETEIKDQIDRYTKKGIRVLALAHSNTIIKENELPDKLEPCAIILLSDVLRSDAKEILHYFSEREVRLMVISGDHPATVANIAREAGLEDADNYIDATTLQTNELLQEAVDKYQIFGRVTPEQKKDIVLALQNKGHIVAMTGDGVNDVLALKEADCSIAMAAGSDAAKNCSNLVLLDSNFSSMPYIVQEGRRVINNIQNAASLFLVKTFFSLILTIFTLIISGSYPFIPIQLTIISMCAVGIPTFILSLEPNFHRVKKDFVKSVLQNALTGAFTIIIEICCITLLCRILKTSELVRSTMCVLSTGVTSLYMIRKVYPLESRLRKIVYYSMFILFLICMFFLPSLLKLSNLNYKEGIALIGIILFTPYLIDRIYEIFNSIKHKIEKKQKRDNINIGKKTIFKALTRL